MEIKDIVKHIVLPFLPAKTLVRCRSVSKEWDERIRSPFLAHEQSYYFQDLSGFFCQHHERNPTFVSLNSSAYGVPTPSLVFLPEPVNIISSCNGLLLCQGSHGSNPYYICNPANEEWRELPEPEFHHGSGSATLLAFEPSPLNMEAHYQLISAVKMIGEPVVFFELYSSKTQSWRTSNATFIHSGHSTFTGNGFYIKGIAYFETSRGEVLAFDLKNEVYEVISLPSDSPPEGVLTQIHGEICYIGIQSLLDKYSIKIYAGIDLSLKRAINVNLDPESDRIPRCRVLPSVDGNEVMILVGSYICSYNISDQRTKVIERVGDDSCAADTYLAYVNSLVHVA